MCVCVLLVLICFEQNSLRHIFSLLSFSETEKVTVGTPKKVRVGTPKSIGQVTVSTGCCYI